MSGSIIMSYYIRQCLLCEVMSDTAWCITHIHEIPQVGPILFISLH
jgi:hypothetical protein